MGDDYDFLSHLVGKWILTGKMGNVDLHQEVTANWILGGKFLLMQFKSTTPEDNPTSNYEAVYHIGFNEEENVYVLHLLDTTEVPLNCVVGRGKRNGDSIPFLFEYGDTKFFNVFAWDSDENTWSFHQTFEEDGKIKMFAHKEMTKNTG
jgi:hypothetical protein